MLDTKPIRYFIAVAEELHFSRAAERLFITQSALSVQISNLEERLGTRLLNRKKRSAVSLTEPGKLFLIEARIALEQLGHAENIGRRAGRGEIGHVQIGYVASASFSGILTMILREFHAAMPDVTISIEEMATPRQFEAINLNRLDIGFLRPRPNLNSGITTHIIHSEGLCVALPQSHPLSALNEIAIHELKEETFIQPQFEETFGFGQQVSQLLGKEFGDMETLKVRDFLSAATLVSSEFGVAIVPVSIKALSLENVIFIPLKTGESIAELAIAYRSDELSSAVLSLINIAKSLYKTHT